uniref:dolichyl-phosphooligosaccharide-protein glycotransferase n=1 Tax=Candidatus Methanophaga sp. ANME-1 ERB7 TaxID=2759913 RepID=A0A7G9Z3N6_9EURY|nr:hypothetical protein GHJHFCIO_00020 [Methanosarcinales archaeon ANME-1 ERB7]
MDKITINLKGLKKATIIYGVILVAIFCVSLYIRGVLPYASVFTDAFVKFGGNDPWYKMRVVENTLQNFPHRMYFDPFTYYPHGTHLGVGPLFDYLLAVIIWLIGLGNPFATLGQHGIEVIGAWYPAVLGALTVLPVYFIGKELWGRNAGILSAALIAILPGQFLSRSLLGFTDHHAMETLFSTISILFIILAIKTAKKNGITYQSILKKDWTSLKRPMLYSFLGGLFLGSYYLAWMGASLFIFVLIIYAVVQYVLDHVRGVSTDYLCIIAIPVFLISLLMIAPVPYIGSLTGIPFISLLLAIAVFLILSAISFLMNYKKINPYGYPIAILVLAVISIAILSALSLPIYSKIIGALHVFLPSESSLTIAEVHPMKVLGTSITRPGAWEWFTTTFFVAFAAFPWIGYNIAKKFRAEEILILVWSVVMLFACFGQNRFAAYYAVNVALLCGFVSWKIIEFVWIRGAGDVVEKAGGKIKGKTKGGAGVEKTKPKKAHNSEKSPEMEKVKRYLRPDLIITCLIIGVVVFLPPLLWPHSGSLASAKYGGGPANDWYESLSWMRNNTPDTGVDYYAHYDQPPINETTGGIEDYKYPESAYSVISWWDYGHWITRIARRIPVANPFGQQGIGGPYRGNDPGACVFFVTTNVSEANNVADALDVKYVVTDFMMADAFNAFYNKFGAMTVWFGDIGGYYTQVDTGEGPQIVPSTKYFSTIVARLHIFDGRGVALSEEFYLEPLRHYRLIHESPSNIIVMGGQPIKYVKVFEYVKGAKIKGTAPIGSLVEIATNVSTNRGRKFIYAERMMSNGTYEFTVPYSTEGPIGGGTNFDVFASPYAVSEGYVTNATVAWTEGKEVNVLEEAVMEGKTITVN